MPESSGAREGSALVTGASSGLGEEFARLAAELLVPEGSP